MKTKLTLCILAFAFASIITPPSARASDWDQASKLTFSQPVQIPGRVLPAGTYWFVLSSIGDRSIVQVFNSDRSMVYSAISTVATQRVTTSYDMAVTFAQREPMQPQAIVSWFYPGEGTGHQFLYSKLEEREIAQVKHYTITASAQKKGQNGVAGY